MQFGDLEIRLAHIDTGYLGAFGCHGFSENAAATADIEHCLAFDVGDTVYVAQAQGIDLVQGLELAVWIPPTAGQFFKFVDFRRIDVMGCAHLGVPVPLWGVIITEPACGVVLLNVRDLDKLSTLTIDETHAMKTK